MPIAREVTCDQLFPRPATVDRPNTSLVLDWRHGRYASGGTVPEIHRGMHVGLPLRGPVSNDCDFVVTYQQDAGRSLPRHPVLVSARSRHVDILIELPHGRFDYVTNRLDEHTEHRIREWKT
ncbi:hypothetical protein B4N89_40860 [Embleya scabrispora]|uniref:Uncharacterized protein n=1 Tax=Embleya scabrispora TaxID=159449 RepID=A0A1T3NJQ2_9ACTN|nr:hypothetical protein [Embleya scabrispora]OPC76945.1 hypothetical protein B4N89_40860 [Embleya scabrispora]